MGLMDLTGQRFGRLVVLYRSDEPANGQRWVCRCDCGKQTLGRTGHLRAGSKISCGCAVADAARINQKLTTPMRRTHGLSHTRIDHCYKNMIFRCYKPTNKRYAQYGGRGIRVCQQWLDNKQSFFDWAFANGYADHLTIDRIDVDKDYSPANCRWADSFTQMNNTSRNCFIEWDGKRQTIEQWARELGVLGRAIQHRIARGWSVERVMTQPFRKSPTTRKRP